MTKKRKKTFKKEVQQKRGCGFCFTNDAELFKRLSDAWKTQSEFYERKRKRYIG